MAEVTEGLFFNKIASIRPRLPVRGLPRRPSTLKSADEALMARWVTMWAMCRSTHIACPLEFPRFDAMACKRWAELKGVVALGQSRIHLAQHPFSVGNLE